jgi:uncharacterized ferritin-like protein (DUF455 family)
MKQAVDYVLADELTHVRFGSDWVREFCKNDSARLERANEFRKQVDKQFNFGGARSAQKDSAIPIAFEDRREAGFTDDELNELVGLCGEGPSRETMRAAARVLRERHQARKAAQAEAKS